jgi:hypothetical protein
MYFRYEKKFALIRKKAPRKNAQVVTDLETSCNMQLRFLPSRYQDVFALLVPSCCHKFGTSTSRWPSCKVIDENRPATSCPNKTNTGHQFVNNLLRADDIRLDACSLALSTLLQDNNNLFQICWQLGTSSANTRILLTSSKICTCVVDTV